MRSSATDLERTAAGPFAGLLFWLRRPSFRSLLRPLLRPLLWSLLCVSLGGLSCSGAANPTTPAPTPVTNAASARQSGDRVDWSAYVRAVDPPAAAGTAQDSGSLLTSPARVFRPGDSGSPATESAAVVAARVFLFSDSQLHYQLGKRTFAQSPFAERMAFEVAVRPAALDDGSDLLLWLFMQAYGQRYADHELVFLGDAADLSCVHEMRSFVASLRALGVERLLGVTSNHDGFYAGNFTSKRDVDGSLALTDMPNDWTRACSRPGSRTDYRLTKGRAVAALRALLPEAPSWATEVASDNHEPTGYRDAYLYYVRPLGGGDPGAPPVWGVFLDTVDYRGFDFESSRGAGSTGVVSREQLGFLDRAMFEARVQAANRDQPITFVLMGHHAWQEIEPKSRRRLAEFLDSHATIVAYVSAHTHLSQERHIALPSGRKLPELIVGSTTDAPASARLLEVRVEPGRADSVSAGRADLGSAGRAIVTKRLVLDEQAMCADIAPMAQDTSGYTGYRILRDSTPELDIGILDKLLFATGLSDLGKERAIQAVGALLMENELVRAWATLYRDAPMPRSDADTRELDAILARRYAGADSAADVQRILRGEREPRAAHANADTDTDDTAAASDSDYDTWNDPVIAHITTRAERVLHRFARHRALMERLRAARTHDAAARRYFICHAIHAANAEARAPRERGNVLYIR